jgi:hypothetical protein
MHSTQLLRTPRPPPSPKHHPPASPPSSPPASDSANLDRVAELLVRTGAEPTEALMLLVPEAFRNHPDLMKEYPEVRALGVCALVCAHLVGGDAHSVCYVASPRGAVRGCGCVPCALVAFRRRWSPSGYQGPPHTHAHTAVQPSGARRAAKQLSIPVSSLHTRFDLSHIHLPPHLALGRSSISTSSTRACRCAG